MSVLQYWAQLGSAQLSQGDDTLVSCFSTKAYEIYFGSRVQLKPMSGEKAITAVVSHTTVFLGQFTRRNA